MGWSTLVWVHHKMEKKNHTCQNWTIKKLFYQNKTWQNMLSIVFDPFQTNVYYIALMSISSLNNPLNVEMIFYNNMKLRCWKPS